MVHLCATRSQLQQRLLYFFSEVAVSGADMSEQFQVFHLFGQFQHLLRTARVQYDRFLQQLVESAIPVIKLGNISANSISFKIFIHFIFHYVTVLWQLRDRQYRFFRRAFSCPLRKARALGEIHLHRQLSPLSEALPIPFAL